MISAVVVNWNSGSFLEKCIHSLLEHGGNCEIVVVDNASEDASMNARVLTHPALKVIRNPNNLGFAAANNQGWHASQGQYIVFLNPDTECLPGALNCMVQAFAGNSAVWAVGGQLLDESGKPQIGFNVRAFPTVGSVGAEMLLLDEIWPSNPWTRRYRMTDLDYRSIRKVDQPAAACLMLSRDALESVGGFDENFYPAWFEDVDLCKRILDKGRYTIFQPEARFLHHGGSSLAYLAPAKFLEHFHRNQIRYFRKHYGPETALRVRRLIRAGLYLRAALSLIRPPIKKATRASCARIYWDVARKLSSPGEVAR